MLGDERRPAPRRGAARASGSRELAGDARRRRRPGRARPGSLALGQQQQVEIIKALWRGSQVLILDEPTSMLTPQGVAELAEGARRASRSRASPSSSSPTSCTRRSRSATASRSSSQGGVVGALEPGRAALGARTSELQARIVALMFGERGARRPPTSPSCTDERRVATRRGARLDGEPVARARGRHRRARRRARSALDDVSLARAARARSWASPASTATASARSPRRSPASGRSPAGEIRLVGALARQAASVAQREKLGLRYVTDDRLGEGIGRRRCRVGLNLVLKRIGQRALLAARPHPARGHRRDGARARSRDFDIRTPGAETRVGTLSGGNIQKVLLARELSFDPKVVVFNKPTYGLDVRRRGACAQTHPRAGAERGVTSLVISTDLDELLDLCDRIAVLSRGRVAGVVENGPGAAAARSAS